MEVQFANESPESDCGCVLATDPEWRMLRATAVDVAGRAAFAGYASDRFGAWELCAQRRSFCRWPPGTAMVQLSVLHRHRVLTRLVAGVRVGKDLADCMP